MEQLPLGVRLRSASSFATFVGEGNEPAVAALRARATEGGLPPVWLWGPAGSGRTHLLQAGCALAGERGRPAAYLPLAAEGFQPAMLGGLEQLALVCLDDLHACAGDPHWERALFVLFNELAERGGSLVCAGPAPPAALPWRLADLASRFGASVVWQLRPLGDEMHARALQARAAALGLELPEDTLQYLLRRLSRDYAGLCAFLDRLDGAALARQRRLTVPFVKSVLESPPG